MLEQIIEFILHLVDTMGYLGIFIMMALESSFIPFPSEAAMIPAGFLVFEGKMNFLIAFLAGLGGSLFGASVNYFLGKYLGKPFLIKYGKYLFFKEEYYDKSQVFFEKHGTITTFLGRLIPVIRQYISFPAGVFSMNFGKFLFYTGFGAGIWVFVLLIIGYLAGKNQDLIAEYSHEAIFLILVFVIFVGGIYIFYNKKKMFKETSLLVLFNKKGQIFLQNRKSISKYGEEWGLFGGTIEDGETKEKALVREIEEEIGIKLKNGDFTYISSSNVFYHTKKMWIKCHYFACIMDLEEENIIVNEGDFGKFFGIDELFDKLIIGKETQKTQLKEEIEIFRKYYLDNIGKGK